MRAAGTLKGDMEERLRHDLAPVLLVARVVTARVYPADRRLDGVKKTSTISDAIGRANMPGYDAHFAVVKQTDGAVFDPVRTMHEARVGGLFTELVVFDAGQVLPIAIVEPSEKPAMGALMA
jgi:hypothetical protein